MTTPDFGGLRLFLRSSQSGSRKVGNGAPQRHPVFKQARGLCRVEKT
jgi:hypothetical protein